MKSTKGMRAVSIFEIVKGTLVSLVAGGILALVNSNVEQTAKRWVHRFQLDPAEHLPRAFIELASRVTHKHMLMAAGFAIVFAGIRFAIAFGLWRGRRWAAWLGAAAGLLYVPIELYELHISITTIKVAVLLVNIAIVGYMFTILARSKHERT
jgi:uncharacterized membrane protein (DUF2068 family)